MGGTLPERLFIEPCPCKQCKKVLIRPIFYSQDASIYPEEADALVRAYNAHKALLSVVKELYAQRSNIMNSLRANNKGACEAIFFRAQQAITKAEATL